MTVHQAQSKLNEVYDFMMSIDSDLSFKDYKRIVYSFLPLEFD